MPRLIFNPSRHSLAGFIDNGGDCMYNKTQCLDSVFGVNLVVQDTVNGVLLL